MKFKVAGGELKEMSRRYGVRAKPPARRTLHVFGSVGRNNGRSVASRRGEKAKTLVAGRFCGTDEVDYFRMGSARDL